MSLRSDITTFLGADWDAFRDSVHRALRTDVPLLSEVNGGILSHPGKMVRPLLTLLSARACRSGAVEEDTVRFAAALELLHNATLLHDDVADRSEERRGAPTLMSLLGSSPAVLVGDFWLARAVQLVVNTRHFEWAVGEFSQTLTDLAEGEMLQQQKACTCDTTQEDYHRIIYGKTASLFRLACLAGARSVDAPTPFETALGTYGQAVGMAFQIKDDILDYTGEQLGKPVGLDLMERKITAPLLGALREDPQGGEIRARLRDIPAHPSDAAEIRRYVLERGGIALAQQQLDAFILQAQQALELLPPSQAKDYLTQTAHYIGEREK